MFNPEEFLKITDTIRRQKKLQTSAGVRTALNRAYFAALVMAKIKLEDLGVFFSTNDEIHKQISDEVKKRDNILGDKLEQLYDNRWDSDFDLNFIADKSLISPASATAKSFISRAKSQLK